MENHALARSPPQVPILTVALSMNDDFIAYRLYFALKTKINNVPPLILITEIMTY